MAQPPRDTQNPRARRAQKRDFARSRQLLYT